MGNRLVRVGSDIWRKTEAYGKTAGGRKGGGDRGWISGSSGSGLRLR